MLAAGDDGSAMLPHPVQRSSMLAADFGHSKDALTHPESSHMHAISRVCLQPESHAAMLPETVYHSGMLTANSAVHCTNVNTLMLSARDFNPHLPYPAAPPAPLTSPQERRTRPDYIPRQNS